MKYFRKLIIENFQSHVYTEIDFVPGLNVFVGPSDSGKSSILRALRWVLFNQPRGTDFIRKGAKTCRVRLVLEDGTEIIRVRGKSENRYILRTPDGKEEVYESIGQGSHQMILQAHQMIPLTWDQKETLLQFASQLEGPFLLSESSGSKAKLIGRISGAHWIDLALKDATREKNQVSNEIRQVEKQKASTLERLQPYEKVPQWEAAVKQATDRYRAIQRMKEKEERLRDLSERLQRIRHEQKKQKDWLVRFEDLPKWEERLWKVEQLAFLLRQLHQFGEKQRRVQREKEQYQAFLHKTRDLSEWEKASQTIYEQMDKWKRLATIRERWNQQQALKDAMQKRVDALQVIPGLMKGYDHCAQMIERVQQLQKYHRLWLKIEQEKERYGRVLSSTEKAVHWLNDQYPILEQQLKRYDHLLKIRTKHQQVQKSLAVGRGHLRQRMQTIEEYTQQYMELLKLLGRCPTCGSPINTTLLDRLEQELCGGEKYAAVGRTDEIDETKIRKS